MAKYHHYPVLGVRTSWSSSDNYRRQSAYSHDKNDLIHHTEKEYIMKNKKRLL